MPVVLNEVDLEPVPQLHLRSEEQASVALRIAVAEPPHLNHVDSLIEILDFGPPPVQSFENFVGANSSEAVAAMLSDSRYCRYEGVNWAESVEVAELQVVAELVGEDEQAFEIHIAQVR